MVKAILKVMKAYKDSNDDVWLLDPIETQRFNSSASRMAMPEPNYFHGA
jgi:hypothetical protein